MNFPKKSKKKFCKEDGTQNGNVSLYISSGYIRAEMGNFRNFDIRWMKKNFTII